NRPAHTRSSRGGARPQGPGMSDHVRARYGIARKRLHRNLEAAGAPPPCLAATRARPATAGATRRRAEAPRCAAAAGAAVDIICQRTHAGPSEGRVLDLCGKAALQDLRATGGAAAYYLPLGASTEFPSSHRRVCPGDLDREGTLYRLSGARP